MYRQHIVKISTEGSSARFTLPRAMVTAADAQIGDHFAVTRVGRSFVFTPIGEAVSRHVMISSKELLDRLIGEPA